MGRENAIEDEAVESGGSEQEKDLPSAPFLRRIRFKFENDKNSLVGETIILPQTRTHPFRTRPGRIRCGRLIIGMFLVAGYGFAGIMTYGGFFTPGGAVLMYVFVGVGLGIAGAFLKEQGAPFGYWIFFAFLIGFPILKLILPRTAWGRERIRKAEAAAKSSIGGGHVSTFHWSSGGSRSSGSSGGGGFSGGGGSFGGGGASGSW